MKTVARNLALAASLFVSSLALADGAAGVSWTVPSSWSAQGQRPMRAATYSLPAAKGDPEAAELGVFYFGQGQGGAVDANIQRWISQFTQPDGTPSEKVAKRSTSKIAGFDVTQVELTGTFASGGMMMGPRVDKPGYALVGAIVQAPEGAVFFKLTGPQKTVQAAKKDFQKLLQSLKAK